MKIANNLSFFPDFAAFPYPEIEDLLKNFKISSDVSIFGL